MRLVPLDWAIIIGYFILALAIGLWAAKKAGESADQFFLSGRDMPWWLLGFSMVATTFSTDTPNLVTDIVRSSGVSGNWVWWAFLLTGMLTVFLYAGLWRRSEVLTDVEFYELRYSGKPAAFLRGFRALYLGVFFNVVIMAMVSLAAIKLGRVMMGISPLQTILLASVVTVIFSAMGGLRSVVLTDAILFVLAMVGAVAAAVVAVNHAEVGGLEALMAHPNLSGKLDFIPSPTSDDEKNLFVMVFLMPLAVQWWSTWYPGSEPGGGGYQAQRMLAAKDETHAIGATLFFNVAHYSLRPWPWILVGLASLVVFPDLKSLAQAFPDIEPGLVKNDLAYPAMLTFLPPGWKGLVLASLVAAYMSTISTHLNWGSSYVVNDFYKRFVKPEASERELVWVGRISTAGMMVVAAYCALQLESALEAFQLVLQIGAGTGLLFILRWFWWRINAFSEIVAMVASLVVAIALKSEEHGLAAWEEMLLGVVITTVCWVVATLVTPPTERSTLLTFCVRTNPGGPGWAKVTAGHDLEFAHPPVPIGNGLLCMGLACGAVYSTLFGSGRLLYGQTGAGIGLLALAALLTVVLFKVWKRPEQSS